MRLTNRIRLAVGLPFKPEDHGGGLTLIDPGPRTAAERAAWELRKNQIHAEAIDNWDTNNGTCLRCDLPMRLHPPGRAFVVSEAYCDVARQRTSPH